jgi:hypothetical protein
MRYPVPPHTKNVVLLVVAYAKLDEVFSTSKDQRRASTRASLETCTNQVQECFVEKLGRRLVVEVRDEKRPKLG